MFWALICSGLLAWQAADLQKLKEATVKIIIVKKEADSDEVKDVGYGSGTIIRSIKDGDCFTNYIVTAGHLVKAEGKIRAEVFRGDKSLGYYECEALCKSGEEEGGPDLALLSFRSYESFNNIPIASENYDLKVGDLLISFGCPFGKTPPSALGGKDGVVVMTLSIEAPFFVETRNAPELGRSGGGLFNRDGELVGACSGQTDCPEHGQHGIFSSYKDLIKLLKEKNYNFLLKTP